MREARLGGKCADCGKESADGLYWDNLMVVLDFGLPDTIYEPDTTQPVRCDDCELIARAYESGRWARRDGKPRVTYQESQAELQAWLRGWDEG